MIKTVTFIGDVHLSHVAPSSRQDDYPRIILDKILKVKEYAPADYYIFTGDLCHRPLLPDKYKNLIIPVLRLLGNNVYTIIGNHDAPNHDISRIDEVSLGILFQSGCVNHLDKIEFECYDKKYCITGCDYLGAVPMPDSNAVNVLVAHNFYQNTSIITDEIKLTDDSIKGYRFVVLGHDHAKYKPYDTPTGATLFRPGSLSRGTTHNYNLNREISVLSMVFTGKSVEANYINIPSSPAKSAFKQKAFDKKLPTHKDMITFIRKFLIADVRTTPVFSVLDRLPIEDVRVRNYLESTLLNYGFVRGDNE